MTHLPEYDVALSVTVIDVAYLRFIGVLHENFLRCIELFSAYSVSGLPWWMAAFFFGFLQT